MGLKILFIIGTRPEAIKMAPVIKECCKYAQAIESVICVTGQHRDMLDQVLDFFKIIPDFDLNVMQEDQTLTQVMSMIMRQLEPILVNTKPDCVLVQGDTATAFAGSMAAFYQRIKVVHIEAGLRTYQKYSPFPEEINRQCISLVADIHCAPTEDARKALIASGILDAHICVTGNTVVDALFWTIEAIKFTFKLPDDLANAMIGSGEKRVILVTGHRRESIGMGFEQICAALRTLAEMHPDVIFIFPVHPHPVIHETIFSFLSDIPTIHLIQPLSYAPFVWLMKRAYLILTDSGGLQEEAVSLGKPILILRETTERREGVTAGKALLVGQDKKRIIEETHDLLNNETRYQRMSSPDLLYGDGKAANRIIRFIIQLMATQF